MQEEYAGHLKPDATALLETLVPNLRNIFFVVGTGSPDIGKAWLTASIASLSNNSMVIKYDPMLNQGFPDDVGVIREGRRVTEDFKTYESLGLPTAAERNIVGGQIIDEFLRKTTSPPLIGPGVSKKLTFADLSDFLSDKIIDLAIDANPGTIVMEIGGITSDLEHTFLPGALRLLGIKTGVTPEIILLTYLDHSEIKKRGEYSLKTQIARQGIRQTLSHYAGLPLKAVFTRRRYVPKEVTAEKIQNELLTIAYETQISPDKIIFIENVDSPMKVREIIDKTGSFKERSPLLVSACLMGTPCRYNGQSATLAPEQLKRILKGGQVIPVCPEVLAGLPIPRRPIHISGGNASDVLRGKARILTTRGEDMTNILIEGCQKTLRICQESRAKEAILNPQSPSCGVGEREGVATALLRKHGICCFSPKNYFNK